MADVLDCDIVVSEFELQSSYYAHYQINTLGKDMISFIPIGMGWIVPQLFSYEDDFGIT